MDRQLNQVAPRKARNSDPEADERAGKDRFAANSCPFSLPGPQSGRMDYLEKARRVLDIEIREVQRLRERLDENFSRGDLIQLTVHRPALIYENLPARSLSGHRGGRVRRCANHVSRAHCDPPEIPEGASRAAPPDEAGGRCHSPGCARREFFSDVESESAGEIRNVPGRRLFRT